MKKLLLGTAFAILITSIFTFPAKAQYTNTFSCQWQGLGCETQNPTGGCAPGYEPTAICAAQASSGACNSIINQACVSTNPSATRYTCAGGFGGCIPSASGAFESLQECQFSCTATVGTYSCSTTTGQCSSDPNGTFSSMQSCQQSCDADTAAAASNPLCGEGDLGVNTAIGCLMAGDPKQLISQLLGWGVVVGIGIALLMIIFAGFQITTAAGDPKRVKAGQELLTSAISGLLLIIFSIILLNFVGFTLLKLPGFNISL